MSSRSRRGGNPYTSNIEIWERFDIAGAYCVDRGPRLAGLYRSVVVPIRGHSPRRRRGVRHGMASLLTMAGAAVLAGARSFAAIFGVTLPGGELGFSEVLRVTGGAARVRSTVRRWPASARVFVARRTPVPDGCVRSR